MGKLKPRTKHISLAFLGDEWQESYLEFRTLTWADASKLQAEDLNEAKAAGLLLETLKGMFVGGKSIGADGQLVALEAADLDELDLETIATVTKELAGQPSPNG